jgi:enoyl-CoA hydratase
METMADKEFLAEAEKAKLEITPVSGEKIESLVLEVYRNTTDVPAEAMERGLIDDAVDAGILFDRALERAQALAALPPAAFAITKREIRQAELERAKLDASRAEIEQIWTAPDTLNRIRDYVARTLRK